MVVVMVVVVLILVVVVVAAVVVVKSLLLSLCELFDDGANTEVYTDCIALNEKFDTSERI